MHLDLPIDDLVRVAVRETLDTIRADEAAFPADRLALWEPDAAAAVGIKPHALRDLRRKGLIVGSRLGGRIVYTRESLVKLLEDQRQEGGS
mgnify:CR=1 FL=1